jgi:hypothetical protein
MGDGAEVPPPQKIAYVEPQTVSWEHKTPTQAIWMKDIRINVPQSKTTPNFNLY